MLRLPQFQIETPRTLDEALAALAFPGARLVAGGTDILPNLKHRLDAPPRLVSLAAVDELRRAGGEGGELVLGAGLTLAEVADQGDVRASFPALAHAAGVVASPLIRNMGTLGGNVNLDTRCRYVNQSDFWRSAIGGCLKSEGSVCHVVPKGRNCVAALSSDCVPVLIALDGVLVQRSAEGGRREVAVADYFHADGRAHLLRQPGELTCEIRVPVAPATTRSTYVKWSVRGSIDFPLVSLAIRADLEADRDDAPVAALRIVAGVLGSKPRIVKVPPEALGRPLGDPEAAEIVAEAVFKQCKPLENVPYEAPYRRRMFRVFARRALLGLAGRAP